MTEYRVTWTIDLDAESPTAAAHEARRIMDDPSSTATVFLVETNDAEPVEIDTLTGDPEAGT